MSKLLRSKTHCSSKVGHENASSNESSKLRGSKVEWKSIWLEFTIVCVAINRAQSNVEMTIFQWTWCMKSTRYCSIKLWPTQSSHVLKRTWKIYRTYKNCVIACLTGHVSFILELRYGQGIQGCVAPAYSVKRQSRCGHERWRWCVWSSWSGWMYLYVKKVAHVSLCRQSQIQL